MTKTNQTTPTRSEQPSTDRAADESDAAHAPPTPVTDIRRPRRWTLKSLGALGTLGLLGVRPTLAQLDTLVVSGDLTAAQTAFVYDQTEKLTASDGDSGDNFGRAVALSGDGNTALVGADFDDDEGAESGSAYVYDLTQNPPTETKLTPSAPATQANFGFSVALDDDGSTALVGAVNDPEAGTNAGAVYHYDLTQSPPVASKLTASDAAEGDQFGFSVSLNADGTTALVGARNDDDDGTDSGSVYVCDLTQSPPTETKLTASDAASFDEYGSAVALSGDGDTALVGARGDADGGSASGSTYVYDLTQSPPTETKLTASDAAAGDSFGVSVSVSADGTMALVGALGDADAGAFTGSAYVYDLTQSPPTETKLTASDADAGDSFGLSVSVSADGTTALAGANQDDDGGTDSGSAYVYDLTQSPPTETKLTASDADAFDNFGGSVSVSSDGAAALVGALADDDEGTDAGSAYVFELRTTVEVDIDILPGSDTNPIVPERGGVVPVAILHTDDFDPADVDVQSLRFGAPDVVDGGGGATPAHDGHFVDAGDLLLHFPVRDAGFDSEDVEGKLVGETTDGTQLVGTDSITVRGRGRDRGRY